MMMMMMIMMMMSTLATLMLFSQNIPNISLFPSMAVNLADLATRDSTPFARSIFDVYVLLPDPCLNAHNWSDEMKKRLNEKKSYTLSIHIYIAYMYYQTCRDAFNRSVDVFEYIRSYIHAYIHAHYIYVHTYTFIHIRSYIYIHIYVYTYIHIYIHVHTYEYYKGRKKEIYNKYVLTYFLFKKFFCNHQLYIFNTFCNAQFLTCCPHCISNIQIS